MNDLMSQAVDLMIAGMGLIGRFAPPEPATPAKTPRAKPKAPASVDPDTAEAIKKAIAQFRSRHKK